MLLGEAAPGGTPTIIVLQDGQTMEDYLNKNPKVRDIIKNNPLQHIPTIVIEDVPPALK